MIPLNNSLPYDIVRNDVFAQECPYCRSANVLLPLKPEDVKRLYGGIRKLTLVFPCCHGTLRIIDADQDYLLANRQIRG
ncbi:hypothetical protein [Cohnella cholangitidis]|uniref:Uncharacterized protein n=1 Tax=Cohnella cholangitidis TaxID=2598458 RepID=A0A7G5BVE4_9BACL|nr:hypothetical protein [Cohnella cholangitidis]QMV40928.1 hypothetical protein FPL14_06665 [Cohnella cholangitidis]